MFGINFYLHSSWFIVFVLSSVALAISFQESYSDWNAAQAWVSALTTSSLFFISLLLHELGHSWAALKRGIPVYSITLFIFGGMARIGKESDSPGTEFWVAIAGPVVSIGLALGFLMLYGLTLNQFEAASTIFETLILINLAIALFNLLPGFPLDGGRVLRAAIWQVTGSPRKAMIWSVNAGRTIALGLIGYGLFVTFYYMYPINGLWLIGIGGFILVSANSK